MTFVRKKADITPIVDTVFAIVNKAKEDKAVNGSENVIDATIGSLYGEDETLVALDEVFDHYDEIDHRTKAAYASSFTGNPGFRKSVYEWVTQGADLRLHHSVIATPGGSGADFMAITSCLDAGETLLIPDVAWGSYTLMAHEYNIDTLTYSMFEADHFNLNSVKERVQQLLEKQDRIVMVINDPCHNPTGYSLTQQEWKELVSFINEVSQKVPFILIDDIAYIDYSNDLDHSRKYMETWNDLSDNAMVVVAFSCSKTLTSYGLRCGAAIILNQSADAVREVEIVFEKKAKGVQFFLPVEKWQTKKE